MTNIDYLITIPPFKGWDILGSNEQSVFKIDVLEKGKMGKNNDLSDFDKGVG